jgi:hypothetical protein
MLTFYLYTHTRPDINEIFYVGIGRTERQYHYDRAYTRSRRSPEWKNIVSECDDKFIVNIVNTFTSHEECCIAEITTIQRLGRKMLGEGTLVNKAPGGHRWKDTIKVYQYDLLGNYLAEWISPKAAENVLGISYTSIYKSCRSAYKAGNYMFRTVKHLSISPWSDSKCKIVSQFTVKGKLIKTYISLIEAAKFMCGDEEHLRTAIKKKGVWKNFYWSFNSDYCIVRRLIYQYTLDGRLVETYTSLNDIRKHLNLKSINSVDNAIKGIVQKQAYGYKWESKFNVIVMSHD